MLLKQQLKRHVEKRRRKPQKKESHPMASFAEAPAGDVAKGTRIYTQDFF
jgi:hypothetical protein